MRANAACQQTLLSQYSWPVVRQKCTYGNMVESEFLCVKCNHTNSNYIRQYMLELLRFLLYCSGYLPSLNYCQGKNIDVALDITLVKTN